jgi:hypothetical protein
VLAPDLANDAEFRARFEREAKAISALNPPHICGLYDIGREHDTEYLVLELLEGETLAARILKRRTNGVSCVVRERGCRGGCSCVAAAGEIAMVKVIGMSRETKWRTDVSPWSQDRSTEGASVRRDVRFACSAAARLTNRARRS